MDEHKSLWLDWESILAYDAKVTIVIGERGLGKTFGLRLQCIRDFIKSGWRFVVVVRYATELKGDTAVQRDYFGKVMSEGFFKDYIFKVEGTLGYIAKKPETDDEKPKWELICYFLALSQQLKYKGQAFPKVKRIVFDECVIPKGTGYRYLKGEVGQLLNMFSTIAREKPGEETPCRLYLLGNALDISNPYLITWCKKVPTPGTHWLVKKSNATVLLHYSDDKAFQEAMANTVVGQLVEGTAEGERIMNNKFTETTSVFIEKRTKEAKLRYIIKWSGMAFALYWDWGRGKVFVSDNIPDNHKKPILTLVADDATIDSNMISKYEYEMKSLVKLFYKDCLYFENAIVMASFFDVLNYIGLR